METTCPVTDSEVIHHLVVKGVYCGDTVVVSVGLKTTSPVTVSEVIRHHVVKGVYCDDAIVVPEWGGE